jgi:hypothetical protein
VKPPKPCAEHRCREYALAGKSRCAEHHETAKAAGQVQQGTTAAWRRARTLAMERAGYRCERCRRTEAEVKAAGSWLEVHHQDGAGTRAATHDLSKLEVLCREPCHLATLRKATRPTWEDRKAEIRARVSAPRSRA